ncbi:MAG: hypothetical protein ABUK01_11065 [Leptospirales bacterium]
MNRYNRLMLLTGGAFIIIASAWLIYNTYSGIDRPWTIKIEGNRMMPEKEFASLISNYINNRKGNVSAQGIKNLLLLNPRIKNCSVHISRNVIEISLKEQETGYLEQISPHITEHTLNGKTLQEKIEKLGHLNPDQPILYLTASNDIEIKTLKSDIIQLWDKTKYAYSFIWTRISEIEIGRDETGHPQVFIFTVKPPARIRLEGKFDEESFRRLWAILYYLEHLQPKKMVNVQIYNDHAVIL